MSNVWTLSGEVGKPLNAANYSIEILKAYNMRVVFRNLAADTLTFTIPLASLDSTEELVPELGQVVALHRDYIKIFQGHVTGRRQTGRVISITVSGPWWWLERIFLQSLQSDNTGATAERPTYVFPAQSLTTSLETLVNKAIALGVPMGVIGYEGTFNSPPMRVNQTSYAGAIADIVRVTPDMVLVFDYSGAIPRLRTIRRLYAGALTVDARHLSGFELNPMTELQVSQVKVPYMTRDSATGRRKYAEQTAGTAQLGKVYIHTVSGDEMDTFLPPDILTTTVTPPPSVEKFNLKTTSYGVGIDPVNAPSVAKDFDPVISQVYKQYKQYNIGDTRNITQWIGNYSNPYLLPDGPPVTCKNEAGNNANLSGKYILLNQSLPDWAATLLKAVRVTFSGTWYYFGTEWQYGTPAPPLNMIEALLALGGEVGIGWSVKPTPGVDVNLLINLNIKVRRYIKRSWYASVTLVNQLSGTLTKSAVAQPTVTTTADYIFRFPPTGYAAGLLAAQNYIPYEGRFTVVGLQVGFANYRFYAINFSNSQAAHSSIRAMVTEEEIEIATGKTTVRLGPPARFSYRELVNRVKTNANDQIIYL